MHGMPCITFVYNFPFLMVFRVKLKLKKECQIGNNNGLKLIYLHCSFVEISSRTDYQINVFYRIKIFLASRWMRCKIKKNLSFYDSRSEYTLYCKVQNCILFRRNYFIFVNISLSKPINQLLFRVEYLVMNWWIMVFWI